MEELLTKLGNWARGLAVAVGGIAWLTFAAAILIYMWTEFVKLCVWAGQFTWP